MRIATGCLIALLACLWLGLTEAASPPCPTAGACPHTAACPHAGVCPHTGACPQAAACPNACAKTACGTNKTCEAATACKNENTCESSTAHDEVMAAMFGKMVIGSEGAACASAACAKTSACESASACETACAEKTACCKAGSTCDQAIACNKTATCDQAAACAAATTCNACKAAACLASGECPQVIATDRATACESGNCGSGHCSRTATTSWATSCPQCAKLAVASDASFDGVASSSACCQSSAGCQSNTGCQTNACSVEACPSDEQLIHLVKAAQHLTAAGLTDEADCVQSMAAKVRQELIALKVAQVASLQAEIATLGGDCDVACQAAATPCNVSQACSQPSYAEAHAVAQPQKKIAMNVKVVEVSLTKMNELGLGMSIMRAGGLEKTDCKDMAFCSAQPDAIHGIVSALEREHIAKVLSWPTVIMNDGGSFEVKNQKSGAHLDVQAKLLDNQSVRVDIRPRATQCRSATKNAARDDSADCGVQEIETSITMELGKTAVLRGQVQERMTAKKQFGPTSSETKLVRSQLQTLFLVTPELVDGDPAVTAASHEEPSEESAGNRRQEGECRVKALRIFEMQPGRPQARVHYSFPAESTR